MKAGEPLQAVECAFGDMAHGAVRIGWRWAHLSHCNSRLALAAGNAPGVLTWAWQIGQSTGKEQLLRRAVLHTSDSLCRSAAKIQALCLAQALPHPHKLLQILLIPALDRRRQGLVPEQGRNMHKSGPHGVVHQSEKSPLLELESHCTRPCQFQIIALQGIMAQAQASVRNVTANKGHP